MNGRTSRSGLIARVRRYLVCQLLLGGALAAALSPVAGPAVHATTRPIDAHCFQASSSPYSAAARVENGGELVVAKGDPVTIRLDYYHGDDSPTAYTVQFTSTITTNSFTGNEHTFDTQTLWGGGGLATGNAKDIPIDTANAPIGSGRIVITIASDATGAEVLAMCDFTLTLLPPDGDEDGDGLKNRWETNGIDANNDGTIDLKLSADPYNARWNHKDLFVEADYMDCAKGGCPANDNVGNHKPESHVLGNVATSFAAAPVSNPDGTDGITLHSYLDEGVPYRRLLLFNQASNISHRDGTFDELKLGDASNACDGYFGTAAERMAPDCAVKLAARKLAFRYMLFGDLIAEATGAIGIAELPGNDFFVQVQRHFDGSFNQANNEVTESNTFMHELGHTLGLHHGGADDINCKPNYLSVMNYMQDWNGDKSAQSRLPLDFSRQELPPLKLLDERGLIEMAGIAGPAGRVVLYGVAGKQRSADADGPVDWDGDGVTGGTVAADINWIDAMAGLCGPSPGQSLKGHEDWHSLLYDFRQTVDYADYNHGTARPQDELTRAALEQLKDDDLDTIINPDDNCVSVPNTNQANRDHDTLGDACDPDSDPPTVRLVTPAEDAVYTLGSSPLADYACADEPGGSGLASCVGTVANGAALDTSSVGAKSFIVTARDGEGHETVVTRHYRVAYGFEGFFVPVDNTMLNLATAGQGIPLKWRLTDSAGNPVTSLATATVTLVSLVCSTGQTVDELEEYATGSSGLQNLGNGYYQFNWKTPKGYAKSCKTMRLDLGEGAPLTVNFQFR